MSQKKMKGAEKEIRTLVWTDEGLQEGLIYMRGQGADIGPEGDLVSLPDCFSILCYPACPLPRELGTPGIRTHPQRTNLRERKWAEGNFSKILKACGRQRPAARPDRWDPDIALKLSNRNLPWCCPCCLAGPAWHMRRGGGSCGCVVQGGTRGLRVGRDGVVSK